MFYFKELIFDRIPFLVSYEISIDILLLFWIISIVMLCIGLFTRTFAVVNYLFTIIICGTITSYEYHMFYAYLGVGFLFLFMPISKSYSLDALILKLKHSNAKVAYNPDTKVSQIYYFLPLFLTIGLIYIYSVFYKFSSDYWMTGLGMWRPSVFPNFNAYGETIFINNLFLTKLFGYTMIIFEFVFVFLFWFKKLRIPFFITGIGLHLGILIFFLIPWFALGYMAIYLLLVPVSYFRKFFAFFKSKKQTLHFVYDGDCPLCNRTKIIITSLDFFNKIAFVTAQNVKRKHNIEAINAIEDEQLILHIHSFSNKGKVYKGVDTSKYFLE